MGLCPALSLGTECPCIHPFYKELWTHLVTFSSCPSLLSGSLDHTSYFHLEQFPKTEKEKMLTVLSSFVFPRVWSSGSRHINAQHVRVLCSTRAAAFRWPSHDRALERHGTWASCKCHRVWKEPEGDLKRGLPWNKDAIISNEKQLRD